MVRGRKSVPTSLKLVKGERPDRVNHDEPQPEQGAPACPSRNPAVRKVWDYTVAQLTRMRVVTMADRDVLAAYCEAVVSFEQASQMIERDGPIMVTPNGLRAHPAVKMQRDAAAQLRSLASEFGLTPAARTRIKVADQSDSKPTGASRLLSS